MADDNFRGQDNLIELDLSGNKLERFPSAVFQYLTSLKILNLANNYIQELVQRMFFKLSKLTYLDLSYNPLDLLPPDVFRDVQVKYFFYFNLLIYFNWVNFLGFKSS